MNKGKQEMIEEKFYIILSTLGSIVFVASVIVGICMLCILLF